MWDRRRYRRGPLCTGPPTMSANHQGDRGDERKARWRQKSTRSNIQAVPSYRPKCLSHVPWLARFWKTSLALSFQQCHYGDW